MFRWSSGVNDRGAGKVARMTDKGERGGADHMRSGGKKLRVLALVYSMENAAFEGSNILYLNVTGQGTITADNVIFADAKANSVCMALGYADGINGIQSGKAETIYDLSGRRVEKTQRGVYIINGKKVAK